MRCVADLHACEAKIDARDHRQNRSLNAHTLHPPRPADEQLAELTMLCGFDDDLAARVTQTRRRIRGLPTRIHPAPERVLGPRLDDPAA